MSALGLTPASQVIQCQVQPVPVGRHTPARSSQCLHPGGVERRSRWDTTPPPYNPEWYERGAFWIILIGLALVAALPAKAQDIPLIPSAGVYTLRASWPAGPDLARVCFFREDDLSVLGCVTTPVADAASPTGQSVTLTDITIVNPGTDVVIRAYAEDTAGNRSVDSPNRAIADFTAPASPEMLSP